MSFIAERTGLAALASISTFRAPPPVKIAARIIERPPWCSKASKVYLLALLDVRRAAFELVQTVVADDELALAGRGMMKGDLGPQLVRNLGFQTANIRI